jgi:hypothetical protein
MSNVIIGVHGLGNKPEKHLLEKWWKLAMKEGLRSAGFDQVLPKFELAYWADILYEKPLSVSEKDANSPLYLDEPYTLGQKDYDAEISETRSKVVDFLSRQMNRIFLNDDFSLNYSFITDAILRKYFRDLEIYYMNKSIDKANCEGTANELIKKRLALILEKYKDDDILLVGHSMGSIIAFDVLTFVEPHIRIHTFITIGSPLGMPVVISKIAAEQKQIGNLAVQIKTPAGITNGWINFSDIRDNVAFNYKLSEYFTENSLGIKPIDYLVVNNYEINGLSNPHKSFGYLRANEFAKVLNEFIIAKKQTVKQKIIGGISRFISRLKK